MAEHSGTDQPVNAQGLLHPIHIFNDNYYLYAREGETFKSIGKEVGISWRKLAKYNEKRQTRYPAQGRYHLSEEKAQESA